MGIAATAITSACGGKSAAIPDAAAGGDDASVDAPAAGDDASVDAPAAGDNDAGPDAPPGGSPGPTAITIRAYTDSVPSFTGVTENVPLLAFQDGDGAWTSLTGTGGVYHATVSGQRYGIAVGCGLAGSSLIIYYQAISDAIDLPVEGCVRPPADTADIAVSVLHADGKETTVSVGATRDSITGSGPLHLAVPRRMADVFAVTHTAGAAPITDAAAYRGPTINVTAAVPLSVDLAQAATLENVPMRIVDNVPAGHSETFAEVQSKYYTAFSYGQRALFQQTLASPLATSVSTVYKTLAATTRQSGDMLYARAHTSGTTPSGVGYDRIVDVQTATAASLTMTLPDVFTADAPTVDNAAIPQATAKIPMRAPTLGHALYDFNLVTDNGTISRTVGIVIRPGWAQGAATVTVTTPDLSHLAGWTAAMGLLPDTDVDWTILVDDRNIAFGEPVTDGKRILETFLFATIQRTHRSPPTISARDRAPGASCTGACASRRERFAH